MSRASRPQARSPPRGTRATLVREVGRAHEPEREQRRSAHLERPLEAAHPERVEHRGERDDDHHQPGERQQEQADRRVERHHPVAAVVACGACRAIRLNTGSQADEHAAGDDRRRAPREHERAHAPSRARGRAAPTPPANHRTSTRTSIAATASQTRVPRPRRSTAPQSSVPLGAGVALARRLPALGVEAPLAAGGVGWVARRGRSIRRARPRACSGAARGRARGCAPASGCRTRSRATTGPSRSSSRARWRGPSDGDSATSKRTSTRVSRRVGVLPAGTARAARAPLELVERDRARRRDPQTCPVLPGACVGHPTRTVRGTGRTLGTLTAQ